MKNLFILATLTLSFFFVSCEKTAVSPASPSANTNNTATQILTVEYKIQAVSGNVQFEYTGVDAEKKPITITGTSNKMSQSFFMSVNKLQALNIKAKNTNPSASEVSVEIYVNGVLKSYGLANTASKWAVADAIAE